MNAENKRRTDDAAKYLFGKVESIIEIYARSANLPARELADRVGELLLAETMRESLGAEDRMPALPGETSIRRAALAEMAMARNSHRGAQVKRAYTRSPEVLAAARRNIAKAQALRWPKPKTSLKGYSYQGKHWTQQPENKARLRAQMKRTYAQVSKRGYAISTKALAARRRNAAKGRAALAAKIAREGYKRPSAREISERRRRDRERKQQQRAAAREVQVQIREE